MKRISAVLAALLLSGFAATAGRVHVGIGFGLGGLGIGFRTGGFSAFYAGFPGYYSPGYYSGFYPHPYYRRAYVPYYGGYYAAYPGYWSYDPVTTYAPTVTAPAAAAPSTTTTQAPVIINNYNYYNTCPQAGVNAMFGR